MMANVYRAQHIGSLIRPRALIEVVAPLRKTMDENNEGTLEQQARIKEVTEQCIRNSVKEQIERGVRPITSGEFERIAYINGLFENLAGFERRFLPFEPGVWRSHNPFTNFHMNNLGLPGRDAMVAISKIKRGARSPYLEEWRFLKTCMPEDRWKHAKITIITPTWWHQTLEKPYTDDSGYDSNESYLNDIVEALRGEIVDLYNEGLRNIQIDDPVLAWFYVDEVAQALRTEGIDVDRLMDFCLQAHRNLVQHLPSDLNIGHHMCRANVPGDDPSIVVTGGYECLASRLFRETNFTQYCLEHVDPVKHGNLDFLRHLPSNKTIVLGLVSTKFEELEDLEQLKARVFEAARIIAGGQGRSVEEVLRDNIAVSPCCGFASLMDLSAMSIDRQWEKLALLQKLAAEVLPNRIVS